MDSFDRNDAEPLPGGNMSAVARVGATVQRTAGPWTPTIHRLLEHLRDRGVDWAPRPLGMVGDAREVLTYLPGTVPRYPLPDWVWTDAVLLDAAHRLSVLHEASRDFDAVGATWQLATHDPAEVICHSDFAPYNLVFDDDRAIAGVIDWDSASPGPRAWDLAYLAYRLVPLTHPANPHAPDLPLVERRRRLSLLCRTYGHAVAPAHVASTAVDRVRELAAFTAARAAAGEPHVAAHVQQYREDADWLAAHEQQLG